MLDGFGGPLRPDLLYVVLCGPGVGESVAVRVPPDGWVIVDSLRVGPEPGAFLAGRSVVSTFGGRLAGLVLTHPHSDHADGFSDLVEALADGFVGCVRVYVEPPPGWKDDVNLDRLRKRQGVADALSSIGSRWNRVTDSRWEMTARSRQTVNDAVFEALYPSEEALARFKRAPPSDDNRLSSPVRVTWGDLRVILGGDLVRVGWNEIADMPLAPSVADHHCYKVAHHGSLGAQHDVVLVGSLDRTWCIAPFRSSLLPRFEDEEGVDQLLRKIEQVHLTSLPYDAHPEPNPPRRVTRDQARQRQVPGPPAIDIGAGRTAIPVSAPKRAPMAWIAAGFARSGRLDDIRHGPLAAVVREG